MHECSQPPFDDAHSSMSEKKQKNNVFMIFCNLLVLFNALAVFLLPSHLNDFSRKTF